MKPIRTCRTSHSTKKVAWSLIFLCVLCSCTTDPQTVNDTMAKGSGESSDPLPSWNDGETKRAIISYVEDVTDSSSQNFIAVEDRIATFDNDGTLWSEQPAYFQLFFALDRVKAMSADHPEWKTKQPFKAVLENNMAEVMKGGEKGLLQIIMTTHAGMTTDEFEGIVKEWIATATHPTTGKLYTEMIFQPMLELVRYLQDHEFKTFIVSGGGIEFMRPWTEAVYGIPKDQVVGSSGKVKYEYNDGSPRITKLPEIDHIDDKEGKPVGIQRYIGRKPVFACGNSDGDLQMLRWADSNTFKSFKLFVHHTDSTREWAYDRDSPIGTFNVGLDEANEKGWTLVDMANDWRVIYPFELR